MDELVEKVREALAAEYPGAPNGRVRDVPDRRAIRWYTTIGLVDKPLGMRGRTALYGARHLQQLVAIKRLQAEGRSLAQIQSDFTWLSPQGLGEVSQVPPALMADTGTLGPELSGRHARFWADAPAPSPPQPVALDDLPSETAAVTAPSPSGTAAVTAPSPSATAAVAAASPSDSRGVAAVPSPEDRAVTAAPPDARAVTAVPLAGGVILIVPQTLNDSDRADVTAAAAPLIALLAARGLTDGSSS
jgi:hypothetical protein